ncbi:MAG: CRTAC1 family protein [Phycisphaerales bacterium]|nr:CRTAC1 family protein [Phycisphaerales bacterium]
MTITPQSRSVRDARAFTAPAASALLLSLISSPTNAQIAKYSLATSQVGISAESVTSQGYPQQHSRMAGGLSVGDFNNDSYPDLFIQSLGITPNKLYINNQDGTFTDQAEQWGIKTNLTGMGSAVGDVNNDGYLDIYLVSYGQPGFGNEQPGQCILYLNSGPDEQGNHTFTDIAQAAGVNHVMDIPGGMTPAFGDIDLDGDLDLFVATWRFHDSGNRLFENQFSQTGQTTFIDITPESLSEPDREEIIRGFTPHIVDITGDRYPEILLTADFQTSELFVNNGVNKDGRATFRTTTNKSNISTDFNGMGAAVADFNFDGLLDWFQTNIYVATENRGNTLYMHTQVDNEGDPIFQDQAAARGVIDIGWGWGTAAGDFDNDTDQDLVATNGWPGWPNATTRLWSNDGIGLFSDNSISAGLLFNINGRGLVTLDHDKDGDLDLVFIDNEGPIRFYRNDLAIEDGFTNFLRINFDTSAHPCLAPDGFGTKVYATVNGLTQHHALHNNASFLGQSEFTLHIGMGVATTVSELRIEYADGSTVVMHDVPANQHLNINAYHPMDYTQDAQFDYFDVNAFLTAYHTQNLSADLNDDGQLTDDDIFQFIEQYNDAVTGNCH